MGFALYELAEPERMDLADMKSIRDPENLAWFGVTMLLQLFTGYGFLIRR